MRTLFVAVALCTAAVAAAAEPWPPGWKPGYPRGWDEFATTVEDFNMTVEGGRVFYNIDPWKFGDRMGAYKVMIHSAKSVQFDGILGSPLWGLPLQCGWQMQTGRQMNTSVNVVNATSWWGAMNYVLSIVPFLGAVDAGLVAPVNANATIRVLPPPATTDIPFCTDYASCLKWLPLATQSWRNYAAAIHRGNMTFNAAVHGLWEAHVHSLHEGLPLMEPVRKFLPSKAEQRFGVVWANLIDFVAALERSMNFTDTNKLQEALIPPRILRDGDHAPFIKDFTQTQNFAMATMDLVYDANTISKGGFLDLFLDLCCTPEGRAAANQAANDALFNRKLLPKDLIRIVKDLVARYPCPATPAPTQ